MRFSTLKPLILLGLGCLAVAAPINKRSGFSIGQTSSTPPKKGSGDAQFGQFNNFNLKVNDEDILQFALMLEVAQTLFYQQGLSQFSSSDLIAAGLSASEVVQIQNGFIVESTHVNTLVSTLQSLGQQPLNQPQFFFSFSSAADFIEQLAVQELIATDAYLGAAPLIKDKNILAAAASIMCVEARQSSFVNLLLGVNAFSVFETPLSIEQVISLVAPSIAEIPSGTILQVLGFDTSAFALETINVTVFVDVSIGSIINPSYSSGSQIEVPPGESQLYCAFTSGLNTTYSQFTPGQGCSVPNSISSGNLAFVEITVSESIDVSSLLSAGQFVTISQGP